MKRFLILITVCLTVLPLVFATQPTVGLSYNGGYPMRPSYVIGYPNELASEFKVGNSGTEIGIVNLTLDNATTDYSVQLNANDFQLASGETRNLMIVFTITDTTPVSPN